MVFVNVLINLFTVQRLTCYNPTCVFKFLGAVLAVLFVARNADVLSTADVQPLITSKKYYTVNYDFHNECSTFESLLAMFCSSIRTPQIYSGRHDMLSSSSVSRDPDIVINVYLHRNPAAVEPQNLKVNYKWWLNEYSNFYC